MDKNVVEVRLHTRKLNHTHCGHPISTSVSAVSFKVSYSAPIIDNLEPAKLSINIEINQCSQRGFRFQSEIMKAIRPQDSCEINVRDKN